MVAADLVWLMAGIIGIQRFIELGLGERNRVWALSRGAREYGAKHYRLFFILHSGWLFGWVSESFAWGPALAPGWQLWLVVYIAAQFLRYWCITSLGRFWNTRIIVIEGARAVRRGPYRYLAHPNYLAVCAELAAVPLIFGAWITAVVASVLNAALLLLIRIPEEERAIRHLR